MTTFRNVNEALPALAHNLLENGKEDDSRAGKTKELTFQHFTLTHPLEREILVAGRGASLAAQIAETMWVLSGRNDVDWLSAYLPRAADFSDDGTTWRAGYGPRLRHWTVIPVDGFKKDLAVDQFTKVIRLLKDNPTTRRAVMSIFDPAVDYRDSKDIPCNNWLHFLARDGVLDLHVAIRSNDLVWGWSGINQFEWSVLLEIVAFYSYLKPGAIHYAVSSLHMYDRHWGKANSYMATHSDAETPRFDPVRTDWDVLCRQWFTLEQEIRAGVANVDSDVNHFPEPMLRSWLWVLQWWWSGNEDYLRGQLNNSRLHYAALRGTGPRKVPQMQLLQGDEALSFLATGKVPEGSPFIREVIALHTEKHAAYGDSWKRRGEMLGIMANIARKVDRLGGSETADETSADTAADLLVYLAKYRTWLDDQTLDVEDGLRGTPLSSDTPDAANTLMLECDRQLATSSVQPASVYETQLREDFDRLEELVVHKVVGRTSLVDGMITRAYMLARRLWRASQQQAAKRDAALRQVPDSETYGGADSD